MTAFGQTIRVIVFYREVPSTWSPEDVDAGEIITAMEAGYVLSASHLRAQHNLSEQLHEAIASRDTIGQAKGVLTARKEVTADIAFEILRERSQAENRKLRDLAADIVAREGEDTGDPSTDRG